MKTWDRIIVKAYEMYVDRDKYAYFYGAKGCMLTDATMDYLIRSYSKHFAQYTDIQLRQIKAFSQGKIGYDCSGFIQAVTGIGGNSAMQFGTCENVSDNLAAGPAGSLLWKPGHIGLDCGFGVFLHMPREGESIILGKIHLYNWEKTGQSTLINMEGSDSR